MYDQYGFTINVIIYAKDKDSAIEMAKRLVDSAKIDRYNNSVVDYCNIEDGPFPILMDHSQF